MAGGGGGLARSVERSEFAPGKGDGREELGAGLGK